jgi:spore coat protein U-like protein
MFAAAQTQPVAAPTMTLEPSEAGSSEASKSLISKVNIMKIQFAHKTAPAILTLLGLSLAPAAQAVTNTGNMEVSATIEAACSVSASPMAFGTVVPGVDKDTEAVVTVVCTSGTTYTVDLGDGLYHTVSGGTGIQYRRQMASAANRLQYAVFSDVTRATPIEATASAAATNNLLTSTVGNGQDQTVTLYGRVIGTESQITPPGVYADTVIVTVAF